MPAIVSADSPGETYRQITIGSNLRRAATKTASGALITTETTTLPAGIPLKKMPDPSLAFFDIAEESAQNTGQFSADIANGACAVDFVVTGIAGCGFLLIVVHQRSGLLMIFHQTFTHGVFLIVFTD